MTYYSWRGDDGTLHGLARSSDGIYYVVVPPEQAWALKMEILGQLIDLDIQLEKITLAEASGLAHQYGVGLNDAATLIWDDRAGKFVPLVVTA